MRWIIVTTLALSLPASAVLAAESPRLMKEIAGSDATPGQQGCPLQPNLTGDCANLRYYNLCSGYIWIFGLSAREAVGVCFQDSCIAVGNSLDKAITYFRNVIPGYNNTVDVLIDADSNADCCPDYVLASEMDLDPGLRWNCSPLENLCIPPGTTGLIIRTVQRLGPAPAMATDGAFTEVCDPTGLPHSFYYGFNLNGCVPWIEFSPTGRNDNFLYWLVVDDGCATTSANAVSWGQIKGLFR